MPTLYTALSSVSDTSDTLFWQLAYLQMTVIMLTDTLKGQKAIKLIKYSILNQEKKINDVAKVSLHRPHEKQCAKKLTGMCGFEFQNENDRFQ
jgi:hypothetical protein